MKECEEKEDPVIPVIVKDTLPVIVKDDGIKLRKRIAIETEKDEEKASVETKLEQVIEHHSEIGKVLEGIKEQLKPKKECRPDTRGWDNVVEFFSEPI